jgi:GNAT superfamily N-acetyltransferase
MRIVEISNAAQRSATVAKIIETLPEWFSFPEANQRYIEGAASKTVFAACDDQDQPVGAMVLRYHFETTAEIWWMGIKREYHRLGIGARLFEAAKSRARQNNCRALAVMTLSPRSPYLPYANTRAFYQRQGFRLLLEVNESDPRNPLAWMTMDITR